MATKLELSQAPSQDEKPFISPPHSPIHMADSPSASPDIEPSLSRTSSTDSVKPGHRKRLSMEFTSPQARRRGYVRPQGTEFSKSARSRNSVMALGSIAHVQYFFARTGLLEGKGGYVMRSSLKSVPSHVLTNYLVIAG